MSPSFREMRQRATKARFQFLVVLQIALLFVHDVVVLAGPQSGAVVAGSATISGSGSNVTVTQTTNRAVINWQGFSIAKGEKATFNLPGSHAAVLNRVVGADPSAIHGMLNSNGRVYLINPNGVVIGPTGRVNTAGFVASTMNVPNSEFMQGGNLNFTGSSMATVENYGTITASNGDVFLIAGRVINNGTIQSPNGTIGLAAGQDVSLVDSANPKIAVRPTAQSFGGTGVYNGGILEAMQIELVANGGNIYGLAINNAGLIRANGSATVGGRVYLVSNGGNILSTGTLIAKKGEDGGDIIAHAGGTEGSTVVLSGTIDVSGKKSGGIVYMKGATLDATDATIDLTGATRGQVIYLLGPHTVNVDPNASVSGPIHWIGDDQPFLVDTDVMKVKVSMAGAVLDGHGTTVDANTPSTTDGNEFINFKIESADPNNPFLKVVGFNLDELGGGNSITANTEVLFTLRVREPNGTFVTNYLVLDESRFGGNTKIEFSAVNGELIEYITVNSNQGGYTSVVANGTQTTTVPTVIGAHTPVFDTFKQVDSTVTTATATILIVDKQTTPSGDPTSFGFRLRDTTLPPTIPNDFGLADPNAPVAFVLTPDTYSVEEGSFASSTFSSGLPPGWFLTGVDFTRIDSPGVTPDTTTTSTNGGLVGTTNSVNLALNETVTLVFNNTQGGQILVSKIANGPAGSTTNFSFTASGGSTTINPFDLAGGTSQSFIVLPGTYSVTEGSLPTGWFFDSVSGTGVTPNGATGTVTITAGDVRTLTFQNTQGGQITVTKNVLDGNTSTPFDFTASTGTTTPAGSTLTSGSASFMLAHNGSKTLESTELAGYLRPGTYTIAELAKDGWFFDGIGVSDLTNGTTATPTGVVTLTAGGSATLTFRNTEGGQITVSKTVLEGNQSTPFDFNSSYATPFSLTGSGAPNTSGLLRPGSYNVTELAKAGWFYDGVSVDGGTVTSDPTATILVQAGQHSFATGRGAHTVNFRNTEGGQITVSKNAIGPDASTTSFEFKVGSAGRSEPVTPSQFELLGGESKALGVDGYLRPGTYTVEELAKAGWVFDGASGQDGLVVGQTATVDLAAGTTRNLNFQNTQIVLLPIFRWDPIYPDGVGAGGLAYGTFTRTAPAGASSTPGGVAAAGAPGVVLDARGEEEFIVAEEDEDTRKRRISGPKRVRLGGGGESSFEAFRTGGTP